MIVDLTEIESSPRRFEFSISAGDIDLEEGDRRLISEVKVQCEIERRIAQIDVRGTIRGKAEIDCSRCLAPVERDLLIDFAVSFVEPENFASDKEREVSAADLDTDVLDSDRLDLDRVAREQILLNLPEQAFCQADCKGLCPQCGGNRNLIDCKCELNEIDPRWSALKNLR